jgi:hypothetical protein
MENLPLFTPETDPTGQTSIPAPPPPPPPPANPPAAVPAPDPVPAPKNKGGRPKGSGKKQREAAQANAQAPPTASSVQDELNKLNQDYKNATTTPPGAAPGTPGAAPGTPGGQPFVVTGHLALIVLDSLIPAGLAFALNRFGWKVKRHELMLTEQERKDIEPIMDVVVKDMIADPRILLVLALAGAYAGKIPPKPEKPAKDRTADLERQLKEALAQLKNQQDRKA